MMATAAVTTDTEKKILFTIVNQLFDRDPVFLKALNINGPCTETGIEGSAATMWNVLRHQIRNYVQNMKKGGKEDGGFSLTLKRVPIQLAIQESLTAPVKIIWGFVALNDVVAKGLYAFTTDPLNKDTVVSLTMEDPRRFFAKAKVISCQNVHVESRVISEFRFSYRLALEYDPQSEDEREGQKQFADEISANFLHKKKAA